MERPLLSQTSAQPSLPEEPIPTATKSRAQKSNKRPATRSATVQQPPAKKTRATGRGKGNIRNSAATAVPSVEELLAQPNNVASRRVTRSTSIIANDHLTTKDDQGGRTAPDPRRTPSKVQALSKNTHITHSTSVSRVDDQPSLEVPETCTGTEVDAVVPCTPADQMIQTHTPRSPGLDNQLSAVKHPITGQA